MLLHLVIRLWGKGVGRFAFFLFSALFLTSCSLIFRDIDPERLVKAKKLCSEIKVPSDFQKIRDAETNRPHVTIFTTTYASYSDSDSAQFEEFFKKNISTEKGWTFAKEEDLTSTVLNFKDGDWRIIITIRKALVTDKKLILTSCYSDS